ncbi:MAG: class I SAM-dependent methyltransferase [Chloroflexi bacterium]|nr:class I SAM-dependent methyltransferase [Chloroflexota bacterium]
MPEKFDAARKARLDSPERRRLLDPDRILPLLPLKPDHVIADIGCGTGFFSLPLAQRLPRGKVYAVDVQEDMLETVREKLAQTPLDNVETVLSRDSDIPLPPASLDGAFLSLVLHENEGRRRFLGAVGDLLKRGAWMAVLEWEKREMEAGPPQAERIARDEVTALAAEIGLQLDQEVEVNDRHYMLVFKG